MFCKVWITVKSPNTLHNIPGIAFKLLISNLEFLELERGPACQFAVDNVIEFIGSPK
jgi:hypothetical protein